MSSKVDQFDLKLNETLETPNHMKYSTEETS